MKVYGILISKEWGSLGIDKKKFHVYLERRCSLAICNYEETYPLQRQVFQLGGLEMSTTTLLRRQLQGDGNTLDAIIYEAIRSAAYVLQK